MRAPAFLLSVVVAVIAAAVARQVLLNGGDDPKPPAATATATPEPALTPIPAAGPGLAVGITEFNPNLFAAEPAVPEPWEQVRQAIGALQPAFFRLVIDWHHLQPAADQPADLDKPETGCMREVGPCLGWFGVRQQLRALASRQRTGGWETLAVVTGTPDWAAQPPSGCERAKVTPRARAPRPDALPAYRRLVLDVLAAAEQEGATLRFWAPWNEPNLPPFVSPQRAECDPASPSLAPAVYTSLARTLQDALATAPGDQQLLIGETAGLVKDTKLVTSVGQFIAGLPRDLVCASPVYTQHAYIGGEDPVEQAATALAAHDCPQPHTIWITETGVGPAPEEYSAVADPAAAGCQDLHDRLVRWYEDPRVTVAFQYTVREDDKFPVGLFSTNMAERRPSLAEWTAWGGGRPASAPPPASACAT